MKIKFILLITTMLFALQACTYMGLGTDPGERNARAVMDDAGITTSIKTKYLANKYVKGLSIDIDTFERVVTLNGNVDSKFSKELAEDIARNTRGVVEVINKLRAPGE